MTRALVILAFAFRLRRARRLTTAGRIGEARRVLRALERENSVG